MNAKNFVAISITYALEKRKEVARRVRVQLPVYSKKSGNNALGWDLRASHLHTRKRVERHARSGLSYQRTRQRAGAAR